MADQKKTRRQVLEEFVEKSPADSFSRYGLAMECMGSGDPAAAIRQFAVLLEQHADYIPAYLMYGQLLAREARPDEAKQILSTGIAAAARKGDQHAASEMEALLADLSQK
jgi:cytochrome c-type biogenesis protein CcmH/NrfG